MPKRKTAAEPDRIIREPECRELTGLSRTRRYELAKAGEFPAKIKISERASGWRLRDIREWIESRPTA